MPVNTFSAELVENSATITSVQIRIIANLRSYSTYNLRILLYENADQTSPKIITRPNQNARDTFTMTLDGLTSGAYYTADVRAYNGTYTVNNLIGQYNVDLGQTLDIGGTFDSVATSSSAIRMSLSGLPTLEYSTIAEIYGRKNSDPDDSWVLATTSTIGAGEEINVAHLFTGLSAQTYYKFKAILYRVIGSGPYMGEKGAKIKTWETLVTTLAYIPDTVDAKPFFEKVITVPHTGRIYMKAGMTEETPSGLSVHLFKSEDGETYWDIELDSDYAEIGTVMDGVSIVENIGDTLWYKVGLVDSQHNIYAFSDPVTVTLTDITWTDKVAGNVVDLTASEVYAMVDAMIKMCDYRTALGEGDTYGKRPLPFLKGNLNTITQGSPIKGGIASIIGALYPMAKFYAQGLMRPAVDLSGEPIGVAHLNEVASLVLTALENII